MEKREKRYVDVLLPIALRQCLTYGAPIDFEGSLQVGQRVLVSVGRRKYYAALIKRIHTEEPQGFRVKDFLHLLDDQPVVNRIQLGFWEWMSAYYMATEGEVMAAALPSGFQIESEMQIALHPDFTGDVSFLSAKEIQLLAALDENKQLSLGDL